MIIKWNGHACFTLITSDGTAVFDPYAPGYVPGCTMHEIEADAVFCSHGHADHSYIQGVTLTGRKPSFTVKRISCFHDECNGTKRGENLITVIGAEGVTVAHFGDLGHLLSPEQLKELGNIDIMMVPVGGFYTINAAEAKQVCDAVGAKLIIPMHYRGKGYGYDIIDTAEPFLKHFDEKIITRLSSPQLEINELPDKRIMVFG